MIGRRTATVPRPAPPAGLAGLAALPGVVLLTDWTPADLATLSRRGRDGSGWLVPVRLDGGLTLIGPPVGPTASVCLACTEAARLRALDGAAYDSGRSADEAGLRLGGEVPAVAVPLLDAVVRAVIDDPGRHDGIVVAVRADHGTVSTHRVLATPGGCDACPPPPPDSPGAAAIDLAPAPTADPTGLRVSNPHLRGDRLRALLVDWRHGPVARVVRSERSPLPMAAAEIVGDGPVTEAGYGRAASFAEAERVALFEAVERYTSGRPQARRTVVEASFEELGPDRAVDPVRLGLPDQPYRPYQPQEPTRWVYGWSIPRRRVVAVPEHVAYWNVPGRHAGRFVQETSSGCGLGTGLVEAALYGLFEVAERDAFLMAWYAGTPLTRVAPPSDDDVLPYLADRLESVGYDLLLFDATNDLDIPAVLALVLARTPHAPRAYFAAGAHPDPVRAMRAATVEAVANVFSIPEQARADPELLARDRLLPMLADPALVRTMSDHVTLYTVPEAAGRYDFLPTSSGAADWRDVWPGRPAPVADLADLLAATAERLAGLGLEVIVVDQSDPVVHERSGLSSAKVIVPGTLPMTFGHRNRRTAGLPRLVEVPRRSGRLPAAIRYKDLPLHPHPFP